MFHKNPSKDEPMNRDWKAIIKTWDMGLNMVPPHRVMIDRFNNFFFDEKSANLIGIGWELKTEEKNVLYPHKPIKASFSFH